MTFEYGKGRRNAIALNQVFTLPGRMRPRQAVSGSRTRRDHDRFVLRRSTPQVLSRGGTRPARAVRLFSGSRPEQSGGSQSRQQRVDTSGDVSFSPSSWGYRPEKRGADPGTQRKEITNDQSPTQAKVP